MNTSFKKILVIASVVVAALIIIATTTSSRAVDTAEPIKIGAILQLSGDFAIFGRPMAQGAQLAIDEYRAQGINVELILEDDHSQAIGTANAGSKLVNSDQVDGIMVATVQQVKPLQAIVAKTDIPVLAVWDSNDYIKSAGPNIFTIGFNTEHAGQQLAQYAANQKLETVAVISQKDEWSQLISDAFAAQSTKIGSTVVYNDSVTVDTRDFRTQILQIKKSGAQAVFIPFLPGSISVFINQARQLGYTGLILTGDSFSGDEVANSVDRAQGVVFANLYSDGGQQMAQKYQEKYGKPADDQLFVTFGYNGVRALVQANLEAQRKNTSVIAALQNLTFDSTEGPRSFGGKQYAELLEKLYIVNNSEFVEIQ